MPAPASPSLPGRRARAASGPASARRGNASGCPCRRGAGNGSRLSVLSYQFSVISCQGSVISSTIGRAMRRLLLAAVLSLVAIPAPARAWGFQAHQFIADRAIAALPPEIRPFFQANRTFIVEHTIDPDLWRTAGFIEESPRHFLNLDAYGAYPFAGLPRAYDAALAKYGADTLVDNGLLPWRAP